MSDKIKELQLMADKKLLQANIAKQLYDSIFSEWCSLVDKIEIIEDEINSTGDTND